MTMTGWEFLRILCGLYLIPHTWSKTFAPKANQAEIIGFFNKAGLKPAQPLIYAAAAVEVVCAISLITGIYAVWGAWICAAYMGIAAIADIRVAGFRWEWVHKGIEFPVFWMLILAAVALNI